MTALLNGTRPAAVRTPLLHRALGVFAARPRTGADRPSRVGRALRKHGRRIKEGVVAAAACGLITTAAFEWHLIAGLIAAGVSLLVVDAAADPGGGDG